MTIPVFDAKTFPECVHSERTVAPLNVLYTLTYSQNYVRTGTGGREKCQQFIIIVLNCISGRPTNMLDANFMHAALRLAMENALQFERIRVRTYDDYILNSSCWKISGCWTIQIFVAGKENVRQRQTSHSGLTVCAEKFKQNFKSCNETLTLCRIRTCRARQTQTKHCLGFMISNTQSARGAGFRAFTQRR